MPTCDDPMGSRWYSTVLPMLYGQLADNPTRRHSNSPTNQLCYSCPTNRLRQYLMSSISLKSDVIMWPKREKLSTCSLTLGLLLLLAYAKKDFFVVFNLYSQFGFKLFLSFFYRDFSLSLALDNACRTDGVYHPTSAALIIGRQRRQGQRSIYPDRNFSKIDAILTIPTRISYSHDGSHPTYGATFRM